MLLRRENRGMNHAVFSISAMRKNSIIFACSVFLSAATANAQGSSASSSVFQPKRAWPFVALEFQFGTGNLNGQSLQTPQRDGFNINPLSFRLNFQPVHSVGTLSVGPHLQYSLISPITKPTASVDMAWAAGGNIQYQLRLSETQIIIPTASYIASYWTYRLTNGNRGSFLSQGPAFGFFLDLGLIDRDKARSLFASTGISHTFLSIEYQILNGSDGMVNLSTNTLNFGLRLEV